MKKWYQSKTVWLGALTTIMAGLAMLDKGAEWPQVAMAMVGAGIVALRAVTDKPII
jgi:hypothetical protein